jgi:DNA-binding transcriptional LysR family regulator
MVDTARTLADHRRNEIGADASIHCVNARRLPGLTVTDLPLVLALSRGRTLASAAALLDVDASTVFRRLNALEQRVRVRLFDRSARGYSLTVAGERMSAAAERIETELHALDRDITGRDQQLSGRLRVTASETLSHAMLPQLFAQFRARHRGIELVLTIDNRVLDLGRREADVALRTRRPADAALFGRKLVGIAWAVYGSAAQGHTSRRDANAFRFDRREVIGWDEPNTRMAASDWIAAHVPAEQIVYRSNSLVNQLMAARAGIGIALLPCYLADADSQLRRLTPPIDEVAGELWIVTHEDLKDTARVRAFLSIVGDGIVAHRNVFEGAAARRGKTAKVPVKV